MSKVIDVEGIGPAFAEKLAQVNIKTTEQFLERAANSKGRKELAATTGITEKQILKWANRVDLFRIKGIKGQFSDLLEAAGVDTVPELAQRKPANLLGKLSEVNETKKLVRRLPTQSQLEAWIEQAKQLPRKITY